jgi:aldose sugar dehydrogenase
MRYLLFVVAVGCQSSSYADPAPKCLQVDRSYGPRGEVPLRVEVVAKGLEVPWGIAFLPDRSILVTERAGRIRRVVDGELRNVAHVDIAKNGEGGLLGLALAPDFATSRAFYVYLTGDTRRGPRNRVERWQLAQNYASASRDRTILDNIPSAPYHDGGRIAFGPDGKLYIGTGDATEPAQAQDRASLAGKILRLDPDGSIPRDNPFPKNPAFVTGVRNVEAFDWRDGQLVIADHGPSGELGRTGHDEISIATKGANLGWPTIYGCQTHAGLVTPALTWREAVPPGGAVIYNGSIAEWRGDLLVGTLKSHHLHRVRLSRDGRVIAHDVNLDDRGRLRTLAIGPDHELYVTTSNCDGRGTCPPDGDEILRVTKR